MKCQLLTITEDYVGVPSPEASLISEFNRIIERDDSENKRIAAKELAYIYYMVDWESEFMHLEEERRSQRIIDSLFEDEWKPDEAVQEGIEKYKELYNNDYTEMLDAARDGARKLQKYFRDVDLSEVDDHGKLIHKAKDLAQNLKQVGDIIEGLQDLVELVRKNQTTANQNRGGVETNKYSQ